jgi:cytochrome c-type biogenesis protein
MMDTNLLGLAAAFIGGLVSFLSPCVLPLVPAYVSYVAGQSGAHTSGSPGAARTRAGAAALSAFFVLGFSTIFIALGASATALGSWLLQYRYEANLIGGTIVVIFGLLMLAPARALSWFQRDIRFHPSLAGGHPAAAYTLGLAFGFGWTPCIGPVLGAILTLGAVQGAVSDGVLLLSFYAAGLGVPFVLAAIFMRGLLDRFKTFRKAGLLLNFAAGGVMVLMGIAMATGQLTSFAIWLLKTFPLLGKIG